MAETARQQPKFDAPLMQMPPAAAPPAPAAAAPPAPAPRVFVTDRPMEDDAQDASPALARIAELVAHRGAEGPFTVALLGPAGSGKSRALSQVLADAAALSRGAAGGNSPYVPALATVRIDAAELGDNPVAAIVTRVHAAVTRVAPDVAAQAAEEANHSAIDPHARLQSLTESLDTSRRRLDAERRARDEAESRRARLVETILYESAGSRVDAYARANRAGIESALAAFGFTKSDPVAAYKDLVRTLLDAGGPTGRILASVKSLWAYPGQMKRIVWAVIFFALAWGFSALEHNQGWLNSLQSTETLRPVADWLRAHIGWFGVASEISVIAALLCLVSCAWRAFRFSRLLLRGASLVDADLDVRRGELDNLVAHHAQRVEALAGETDAVTRRVMEAEKRAGGGPRASAPAFLSNGGTDAADGSRLAYLAQIDAGLGRSAKGAGRIIVAIDDLDTLAPAAAVSALEIVASALRSPRFGLIAAFDADRLVQAGPEMRARLDRLVQVPFRVDGMDATGWREIVSRLTTPRASRPARALDHAQSSLDAPLHEAEEQMLATLAPLAGPSPRGVKRFVNLYRLGREDAQGAPAAFALALALAIGGTSEEKASFEAMLHGQGALAQDGAGRLRPILSALNGLMGGAVSVDGARRARALAAQWSLPR